MAHSNTFGFEPSGPKLPCWMGRTVPAFHPPASPVDSEEPLASGMEGERRRWRESLREALKEKAALSLELTRLKTILKLREIDLKYARLEIEQMERILAKLTKEDR